MQKGRNEQQQQQPRTKTKLKRFSLPYLDQLLILKMSTNMQVLLFPTQNNLNAIHYVYVTLNRIS